jgi:hypothetical protein
MKQIIGQLLDFVKKQSFLHWLVLLVFCAASVYINYGLGLQKKIDSYDGWQEFFAYSALYAAHSVFAFLLYSVCAKDYSFWKKPGFLLLLFLSFFIFSLRAVIYQHQSLISHFSAPGQERINQFVFNDIFRLLYLAVPVSVVWFFADREQPLYGVSLKNHNTRIYWILLLCMVPLIAGASILGDFLDYYPRFRKLEYLHPDTWKIWVYEICYGLDFTSIELFFRGFMVIAFARYVGMNAILPMAAFYLSIHYGKPMGEAISSFFGGTILGVIAYHSRSIVGGIMVHAGIAWLMEIGGYIGNLFRH